MKMRNTQKLPFRIRRSRKTRKKSVHTTKKQCGGNIGSELNQASVKVDILDMNVENVRAIGDDPITLESHNVIDWLAADKENIAIYIMAYSNKNKTQKCWTPILLKKNYFIAPELNNVKIECELYKNQLDVEKTYKNRSYYRNIGYFFAHKTLVSNAEFVRMLNDKKVRTFKLTYSDEQSDVISLEYLQMSKIGLVKKKGLSAEEKKVQNKNLPYKREVYFEDKIAKALRNYSFQWDQPINRYLRDGNAYFNTSSFNAHRYKYGPTQEAAIIAIKDKIHSIDQCLLEYAPRTSDTNKNTYWRGMKEPYRIYLKNGKYKPATEIGDTFVAPNYSSVSTSINVALRFATSNCCIYKIIPEKGLPYIDMIHTTKYKREKEILLPRGLMYKIVGFETINDGLVKRKVFVLNATSFKTDYNVPTGCEKFRLAKISKADPPGITQVNEVAPILDRNVQKSMRCPNGMRQNPKSGICETASKEPRCPNGTRRNKKTGECESKF